MRTTLTLDDDVALPRFKVKAKARGFRSGVDVLRLNQLNDELEMETVMRVCPGMNTRAKNDAG